MYDLGGSCVGMAPKFSASCYGACFRGHEELSVGEQILWCGVVWCQLASLAAPVKTALGEMLYEAFSPRILHKEPPPPGPLCPLHVLHPNS